MLSVMDSCALVDTPASVAASARASGLPTPLSLREFTQHCPFRNCITLHLKYLQAMPLFGGSPVIVTPERTQVLSMRVVYRTADIGVAVGSRESLSSQGANSLLVDLDVGVGRVPPARACAGPTTAEQDSLFANRNGVGAREITIYFVSSTSPPLNGCAVHPAGQPGAAVTDSASPWTLGHEVGHVLGLDHIGGEDLNNPGDCLNQDTTRLMTGCGTGSITGTPTLSASEIATLHSSDLLSD